ncbi:MAG: glucan biosynthesis protein [Deltaproteobacteria bacterium]|nr:glucan biosynthesis protein [Deltaproteobacteria bacterium]
MPARALRGARAARRLAVLALLAPAVVPRAGAAATFGFEDVAAKAHHLAVKPFEVPKVRVPEWLGKITYDQWRDIRFRPNQALWREKTSPFQVQFFHPGLYYDRTVKVNVVEGAAVRRLDFSPSVFDYGRNDFASKVPQDLGFAGFRLHTPIKTRDYFDEVIVFLGASYFRGVGRDQVFGMSARGLAIDTAIPSGEEFPYFKEFWLATPTAKAKDVTVYALLDSPSLTGAYRFVIQPGEQTVVNIDVRLFLRRQPQKIGIAPLTSMFFHGENTGRQFDDFRPEVHDSDGLLVAQGTGEWLWRPLDNPRSLQVDKFRMPGLRGFGLIQRDRDFASYQDLETHPELRPSGWVTPHGDWGAGSVEVVQIPTKSDTNDNVVVYWVPDNQPKLGQPYDVSYTLAFCGDDPSRPPGGRTIATRRDGGNKENAQRFVVDFAGRTLDAIPADQVVRGDVTIAPEDDAAELLDQHVVKNPATGGWRLTFQVRPKSKTPVELRAFLDKGSDTLTETWSYSLVP